MSSQVFHLKNHCMKSQDNNLWSTHKTQFMQNMHTAEVNKQLDFIYLNILAIDQQSNL